MSLSPIFREFRAPGGEWTLCWDQVFLVSQSSITGSDDGLLQQQVDEATGVPPGGGRWWKVMGWFVFPLRSWEVVLGFTLFGREWREQRFFFWIEHYSASLCRCWNRTNERELDMSMCAGWVFSCSPFFCQSIFSRNLMKKHGPMDRTWDPTGFQEEKGLAWILSALAVLVYTFPLGVILVATPRGKSHMSCPPKNETGNAGVSYERWGMLTKRYLQNRLWWRNIIVIMHWYSSIFRNMYTDVYCISTYVY